MLQHWKHIGITPTLCIDLVSCKVSLTLLEVLFNSLIIMASSLA